MTAPSANSVFVSRCANPSGRCYGYYPDANEHKEICTLKHGTAGTTNKTWWSCFSQTCTFSGEHWVPCRAQNCNVLFPPPTTRVGTTGYGYSTWKEYHDHETTCTESVYSPWNDFFGYQATCGLKYFTCEGGCQHRTAEGVFPRETSGYVPFSHAAKVVVATPYQTVHWYFKRPGDTSSMGSVQSTESGDGSKTESSFSYSFSNSDDAGDYTVTAYVTFNGSTSSYSYTVTVNKYNDGTSSSSSSTDTTPTDNTEDCSDCTDGCSSCPSTDTDDDDTDSDDDDSGGSTWCVNCLGSYDSSNSSEVEHHRLKTCYSCWLYYSDCNLYNGKCHNCGGDPY